MAQASESFSLLGLTEYEGRVYRALLIESPVTAYRLSRLSGVPLSRVYETAGRLVEKGAAVRVDGEPALYVPVPPDQLVSAARNRMARRLNALSEELVSAYRGRGQSAHTWLRGEQAVLEALRDIAESARLELLAAASPLARNAVAGALRAGPEVSVRLLNLEAAGAAAAGFALLADGEQALIGTLGPAAEALHTRLPVFGQLLSDYARLSAELRGTLPPRAGMPPDWQDWEKEKQDRLLRIPVRRSG